MKNVKDSEWPAKADFPIARPGFNYICAACILTGLLFFVGWNTAGIFSLGVSVFICWFFRDPDRLLPEDEHAVVSPADGKVIVSEVIEENQYIEGACVKVSIFMNVFNVHVNRVPFNGKVEKVLYFPGKFVNASFDKASDDNERNALVVLCENGRRYAVVQIAGLIARRIVCPVKEDDILKRGERYGMIRFGSRLDLYLPVDTGIQVSIGDKVKAGKSVIGYCK